MITINQYVKAKDLQEAYELLQKNRNNQIIGGMLWLKMQDRMIPTAIDLGNCDLENIVEKEDEIEIGAMVTLRQLEDSSLLEKYFGNLFKDALKDIVGIQFRNMATVGGSVFSRFGFSDVTTALLALNCDVVLYNKKRISLIEFMEMKYDRDILTHIIIKKEALKTCFLCERKSATDLSIINVAVSFDGNNYNIVVGSRPKKAVRKELKVEALPQNSSLEDISKKAKEVAATYELGSNMRGSKRYREILAEVLIERALKQVLEVK